MMTLQERVTMAVDELRDLRDESDDISDVISAIADGAVPVYTSELMQLAADNLDLATSEPLDGRGPAFDGRPTPVNIVAANVYDHIEEALWNAWHDMQDEEDAQFIDLTIRNIKEGL